MFEGIKRKLYNFLRVRIAPIEEYRKLESPEEEISPKELKLESASKSKQLMLARKRISELEEKISALQGKEDKKLKEELRYQKKIIDKIEKASKFDWYLIPEKPFSITSTFNKRPFIDQYGDPKPFFLGFRFIQTPYGCKIFPLVTNKPWKIFRRGKITVLGKGVSTISFEHLPLLFAKRKTLVNDMQTGTTELAMTPKGVFVPPGIRTKTKKVEKKKKKKKSNPGNFIEVDLEPLRDFDPALAESVHGLYRELKRKKRELTDAKKSEKGAWTENIRLKAEVEASKEENQNLISVVEQFRKKYITALKNYHQLNLQVTEADLMAGIHETAFMELLGSLRKLHSLVAKKYAEDIPTAIRKEMKRDISFLMEQVESISRGEK